MPAQFRITLCDEIICCFRTSRFKGSSQVIQRFLLNHQNIIRILIKHLEGSISIHTIKGFDARLGVTLYILFIRKKSLKVPFGEIVPFSFVEVDFLHSKNTYVNWKMFTKYGNLALPIT